MKSCNQFVMLIQKVITESLSETEKQLLSTHLDSCDQCNELYEMHQSLKQTSEKLSEQMPDEAHFNVMRQRVLQSVMGKPALKFQIHAWVTGLFQRKVIRFRPVFAMVFLGIAFLLGIFSRNWLNPDYTTNEDLLIQRVRQMAIQNQSLDDVDKSPLFISQANFRRDMTGQIHLDFNVTSAVAYSGDMNDPLVQEVVTQSLINATNDGSRLDAVALSPQLMDSKVKEALIFSMLHDKNPAVRINAMGVLGRLQFDLQIQEAIIKVLHSEKTVHMRLDAIELLTQDQADVQNIQSILEDRIEHDENSSVKLKAARFLNMIERNGS